MEKKDVIYSQKNRRIKRTMYGWECPICHKVITTAGAASNHVDSH